MEEAAYTNMPLSRVTPTGIEPGKVYLIGAGPGDPGLITVRGLALLRAADVLVIDQLGAPAFLDQVRPDARVIDVGKRAGQHTKPQEAINQILVEEARAGHSVVRLKGGDPLMFGRGGEEMQVLRAAGVPYELVPGVSSTMAGPAYAGIPLTHREYTPAVAFVTGHESCEKDTSTLPWAALAGLDALVFVMGVGNLAGICQRLIDAGRPPATPVAMIENATTPRQRTVTGTLTSIVEIARSENIKPPALIVVGRVVELREQLAWFERRPLFGRRLVVTRSRAQASDLAEQLSNAGALVDLCPVIRCEPLLDNPGLDALLAEWHTVNTTVFTSVNGVDGFVAALHTRGRDVRALAGKKIVCIGPATAAAWERRGIRPDFVPTTFVAEELLPFWQGRPTEHVAVLRAEKAREVLPDSLRAAGHRVSVVPLYCTVADAGADPTILGALRQGTIDAVTFTSSSTVDNFLEMIKGADIAPAKVPGVAIGPVTAARCREVGIPLLATADEYTIPGLVKKLTDVLSTPTAARGGAGQSQ